MKRTWLSMLATAILLGASGLAPAQESKPVMVVSFSGYDALMADLGMVGALGGAPDTPKMLEGMMALATGGKGLAGVDKSKPMGAVVFADGEEFPVIAFVPVTDFKELLSVLEGPLGQAGDVGDGVYELSAGEESVFITEKGGWAFVSNSAANLAKAPAAPVELLGGLEAKYDLAAKIMMKNVPESIRTMVTGFLQMGAQAAMERQPGETDEQYALRTRLAQQSVEQTVRAINDLDTILVGFAIDGTAKTAYLDFTVTAVEGSQTAQEMDELGDAKTDFAGMVLPGAAITLRTTGKLSDSDATQMKSTITSVRASAMKELADQGLPEEQEQKAAQLLEDMLSVVESTIDSRRMDSGASLILKPDAATLVVGAYLADGAKLEKILKDIVEIAKQEQPQVAQLITLDAETHEGVNLHVAKVPLPADSGDEEAEKMIGLVGNPLEVVVGTAAQSAYVAIGRGALQTLKDAVAKSKAEAGKDVIPMEMKVSAGAIAQFVAEVADDEPQAKQMAGMIAGKLAQSGGKDHLVITSQAVPNGATVRIELQEGILAVLGGAGQMSMMMGSGNAGGPGF